jgi:tetratricopeptide (TPR) repeat protein
LGVAAEEVPADEAEAAAMYRTLLADKRLLVVLDNARHADQVRPLLPASPGCLVLVSSRDRLLGLVARDGARPLTLDALSPAEAGELLARIVGPDRVAAEATAAAELARMCGWLPLALRIAAANLLDQPARGIGDYLAELTETSRLAGLAVDGDPDAAVRAAFDTSYAVLDPDDRRLFRLLGLVPGPEVTAPAAAALAAVPLRRAAQLLDRLASAHLLEPRDPGRFAFHDLLRLYARGRSEVEDSEQERQAALGRLLGWYLHGAAAATQLLYPTMVRLPLPLGQLDRAVDHANAALVIQREVGDRGGEADTLRTLAGIDRDTGRLGPAFELATTAAALAGDTGERRLQADALNTLASVHLQRGSLPQAQDSYRQALELARAPRAATRRSSPCSAWQPPTSTSASLIWRTAAPGRP